MKIGYPCINLSIGCRAGSTFRLKSYSEERLIHTVDSNLHCLLEILKFNVQHRMFFFRITSDIVPFASHPVCNFNWQRHFAIQFTAIGDLIKRHGIRISMHPDQFVVLNAIDSRVLNNSIRELDYHATVLDLMGLDTSAKIQIHVGGVYQQKETSIKRFIERLCSIDNSIRRRLVIENDDRHYTLKDCLTISSETGIPVLFDLLHHQINSCRETVPQAFGLFRRTWKKEDGLPMVDYSTKLKGERVGKHTTSIDLEHFSNFLQTTKPFDFDIMLEIKDKEKSASKAIELAVHDDRFMRAAAL